MPTHTEGTGLIFDVKRFSLHDGPGIRTTIFFQGCPLRCAWCQNPESQPRDPRLFHAGAKCLDCRACAAACTQNAVQFTDDGREWLAERCVRCGACSRIRPSGGSAWSARSRRRPTLSARSCAIAPSMPGRARGSPSRAASRWPNRLFRARSCTAVTSRASTPRSIPRPARLGRRWPDCCLTPILSCSTSKPSTPTGTAA